MEWTFTIESLLGVWASWMLKMVCSHDDVEKQRRYWNITHENVSLSIKSQDTCGNSENVWHRAQTKWKLRLFLGKLYLIDVSHLLSDSVKEKAWASLNEPTMKN